MLLQWICPHKNATLQRVTTGDENNIIPERGIYLCPDCGKEIHKLPRNFPQYNIGEKI